MSDVILLDVDGVLLNWLPEFERFVYEITGEHLVSKANHYNLVDKYPFSTIDPFVLAKAFNKSIQGNNLPAYIDAVNGMYELSSMDCVIHVMTKWNFDEYDMTHFQHRIDNLEMVFGRNIFSKIINIPHNKLKSEYINKHYNCDIYMIDDNPKCFEGISANVNKVLMSNESNEHDQHLARIRPFDESIIHFDTIVHNWEDVINDLHGR